MTDSTDPMPADAPAADAATEAPPPSPLEVLETQLAELNDRHVRLAAEFDNFRKRSARERLELEERAQARLFGRLLDALDDLDRVVASDAAATPLDAVRGGTESAHKKFWKEFTAAGIERIDPAGAAFDPALHEAVSIIPAPAGVAERTVAAVFQCGYQMKGQLVRPARVQVYASEGVL